MAVDAGKACECFADHLDAEVVAVAVSVGHGAAGDRSFDPLTQFAGGRIVDDRQAFAHSYGPP